MNLFTTTLVNWPASYPATEHAGQSTTTITTHILPSNSGRTKGNYFDLPFLIIRKLHFFTFCLCAKFEVFGEASVILGKFKISKDTLKLLKNTKLMSGIRFTEK